MLTGEIIHHGLGTILTTLKDGVALLVKLGSCASQKGSDIIKSEQEEENTGKYCLTRFESCGSEQIFHRCTLTMEGSLVTDFFGV